MRRFLLARRKGEVGVLSEENICGISSWCGSDSSPVDDPNEAFDAPHPSGCGDPGGGGFLRGGIRKP